MRSSIELAVRRLERGELVVLHDNAGPEGSYYLCGAGHSTTPEQISFMVNEARGVILAAVSEDRLAELGLQSMSPRNPQNGVDFAVSVEARQGVTTGISAADRALTLVTLANTSDAKLDLVTPGHIFPLRAKRGGVLVRSAAAEAAVDLLSLAKLKPVAALCECLDLKGALAQSASIQNLSERTGVPLVTVTDVIRHRLISEKVIEEIANAKLPVGEHGEFQAHCFISKIDQAEHLALVKGDLSSVDAAGRQIPVLVRVQAEHRFADLLGFEGLTGLQKIRTALATISEAGRGIFVYIRHPRKGLLTEQVAVLNRQASGTDAGEAISVISELREHGVGAQILSSLGVKRIELLTSSTRDLSALSAFNIELVKRVPMSEV